MREAMKLNAWAMSLSFKLMAVAIKVAVLLLVALVTWVLLPTAALIGRLAISAATKSAAFANRRTGVG